MSANFGPGANNQRIDSAAFPIGALFSGGCWIFPRSMGINNQGRFLFYGGAAGTPRYGLSFNAVAASNKIYFLSGRATTTGVWTRDVAVPLSKWSWVGVSYDGSSTATHPTMYTLVDGVFSILTNGAGLTRTATPSGAQVADNTPWRVGAASDATTEYDGLVAHSFGYDRLLDPSEFASVVLRGVRSVLRGLQLSWRLERLNGGTQVIDDSGNERHGTYASGTPSLGENPPAREMAGALLAA